MNQLREAKIRKTQVRVRDVWHGVNYDPSLLFVVGTEVDCVFGRGSTLRRVTFTIVTPYEPELGYVVVISQNTARSIRVIDPLQIRTVNA